jgi:hypothetical protein
MLVLCAAFAPSAQSQDTIPRLRHILALDFARVQPLDRAFDIMVLSGDSTFVIGQREIALHETVLPDSTLGWLLTERRTGMVASSDSIFLASDLRPVRWTASLGPSRIEMDFVGDSIDGVMWGPVGAKRADLEAPPDLVLSSAMLETILGLLPLAVGYADSVSVLSVDLAGADVSTAELVVLGEEVLSSDSASQPVWVVALQAEARQVLMRVDKVTGAVVRSQEAMPPHVGTMLEIRARPRVEVIPPR